MEDRFAAEGIASDISAYTELGDHRTGWPADSAVSDWLVARLRVAGLAAERVPFSFPLVRPEPSWVGIGGQRVPGAPLYDGGVTGPNDVAGCLTDDATHADGALLVLRDAPIAAHGRGAPWEEARPAVESQAPDVLPGGEARELLDRPYVSLAGGHAYFHSENDTVEKATDAERVARFGRAFRRLVEPLVVGAD